jgi:hypothetical protein
MRRLAAVLLVAASLASAQEHPQAQHIRAYRERLAVYLNAGRSPEQVVMSLTSYFPWFGARFGADVDRDGTIHYYVVIGNGSEMTFFALLN